MISFAKHAQYRARLTKDLTVASCGMCSKWVHGTVLFILFLREIVVIVSSICRAHYSFMRYLSTLFLELCDKGHFNFIFRVFFLHVFLNSVDIWGRGMYMWVQTLRTSWRGGCVPWSWGSGGLWAIWSGCGDQTWVFFKNNTHSHPQHCLISSDTD